MQTTGCRRDEHDLPAGFWAGGIQSEISAFDIKMISQ